jgi:multidrug efflux system membrane fusion protein
MVNAAHSPQGPADKGIPRKRAGAGLRMALFFAALFGVLYVVGAIPRLKLKPELASDAAVAKTAAPLVAVTKPKAAPALTHLQLPGSIEGAEQAAINARASGYLRQWYVDIGDHVRQGQTLALIETPDTDQQVAQAQAQVSGSVATVAQANANYFMMVANEQQAEANLSKAEAAREQSKTDLSHAKAAEAQTVQATAQQRAQLKSAEASQNLAKVTADRYTQLVQQGAVAQQTADQQSSAFLSSQANVEALQAAVRSNEANTAAAHQSVLSSAANVTAFADGVRAARSAVDAAKSNIAASRAGINAASAGVTSNQANLQRNKVLQQFQKVTAPFDGIITARNAEVGALVSTAGGVSSGTSGIVPAGATATATGSLFNMVRTDAVRIFVSVPETFAGSVHVGQKVQVTVQEVSGKPLTGIVNRDAAIIDPGSRTLRTEIDIDNKAGRLRPGMFANISMALPATTRSFRIPDTALVTDAQGTRVALVQPDKKIHFQSVVVGRDYGKEMDITSGLEGDEALVANPSVGLQEGMTVKTVAAREPGKPGEKPGGGATGGMGKPMP